MFSRALDKLFQIFRKGFGRLTLEPTHVDNIWHGGAWKFKDKVTEKGGNTELKCHQSGSNDFMYWYQKLSSGELFLLLFSRSEVVDPERNTVDERFSAVRKGKQAFSLGVNDLDSAVYFCASSLHSVQHCHFITHYAVLGLRLAVESNY
uniref:Ig-like domain-containing protein n=1 Tax=Paramormyrops kingsleyae TaxID=1676925 RepID=A0A3B3Q822_9TELE